MLDPLTVEAVAKACQGSTDTSHAVVTAAITLSGVVIAAFASWLMNRRQAKEIEILKKDLAIVSGRDLAAHASEVRVRAEFRLKIYSVSLDSVQEALLAMAKVFAYFNEMSVALKAGVGIRADGAPVNALTATGFSLPPSVEDSFLAVLKSNGECVKIAIAAMDLPADQRSLAADRLMQTIGAAIGKFRDAANDWKRQLWSDSDATSMGRAASRETDH